MKLKCNHAFIIGPYTNNKQTDTNADADANADDEFADLPGLESNKSYDSVDSDDDDDDDLTSAILFQHGLDPSDPIVQVENDEDDVEVNELLIQKDVQEDMQTSGTDHNDKWATYIKEKEKLISSNTKTEVKSSNFPPKVVWHVVDDVKKEDVPEHQEVHKKRGIVDFDFSEKNRTVPATDKRLRNARINFFELFKHLYPGDVRDNLEQMNEEIKLDNKKQRDGKRQMKLISEREFWVFWGLMLACRTTDYCNGEAMFDIPKQPGHGLNATFSRFDPNVWMTKKRFQAIKKYMSYAFQDKSKKGTDDWWQIVNLFEEFNENRKRTVAASVMKTVDETMSAFKPQTTPTGNLPFISYVSRKPEPLGTEFKTVACTELEMFLYAELCRKKGDVTRTKKYKKVSSKKVVQMTLRLMNETKCEMDDTSEKVVIDDTNKKQVNDDTTQVNNDDDNTSNTSDSSDSDSDSDTSGDDDDDDDDDDDNDKPQQAYDNRNTYLGDAWFASIDLAYHGADKSPPAPTPIQENQQRTSSKKKKSKKKKQPPPKPNSHFIGPVKTSHAGYPKQFIATTMAKWPAGSHLVLKSKVRDQVLYAVGYKYCKKKVLFFIMTDGASHTEPGSPYVAKWKDKNGNHCEKLVPRPECIALYFERSNVIDVLNQIRQHLLKLEKCWVTQCGFFRIITTFFGITVIDTYRGYMHHINHLNKHKKEGLTAIQFADMLALDMLQNHEARLTEDSFSLTKNDREVAEVRRAKEKVPTQINTESQQSDISSLPPFDTDHCRTVSVTTNIQQPSSSSTASTTMTTSTDFDPVLEWIMNEQEKIEVSKHKLLKNLDLKEKDNSNKCGSRNARGRCRLCKVVFPNRSSRRKTSTYCECCTDVRQPPKEWFWVCAEHCHSKHQELVRQDTREKVASERGVSVKNAAI